MVLRHHRKSREELDTFKLVNQTLTPHAREILEALYRAGPAGKLPRDVAAELAEYKLNPWNVTQRIRRMNKCLDRHIAKMTVEKRGLKWALTKWAYDNWGAAKEEIENEGN